MYSVFLQGKVGLQYFLNRGLSQKTIRHFGLGYAPNKWDELLKHLKSSRYNGEVREVRAISVWAIHCF